MRRRFPASAESRFVNACENISASVGAATLIGQNMPESDTRIKDSMSWGPFGGGLREGRS